MDARVILPGADDFDVGEAVPAGVVADEQLVGAVFGHRDVDGLAVDAEVLEARAVERPEAVFRRDGGVAVFVLG